MLRRIIPVLLAVALIAHASAAHAQPAPDTEVVTVEHTYRAQIFLADLVGLSLMGLGAMSDGETDAIVGTGMVVTALGPMAIHAATGNGQGAVISVLMRPTLMVVGGLIGASTASCYEGEWFCGVGEAAIGGAVGYGTAAVLDALVLARVERTERRPSWTPQVAVASGGMRVGIGGTF